MDFATTQTGSFPKKMLYLSGRIIVEALRCCCEQCFVNFERRFVYLCQSDQWREAFLSVTVTPVRLGSEGRKALGVATALSRHNMLGSGVLLELLLRRLGRLSGGLAVVSGGCAAAERDASVPLPRTARVLSRRARSSWRHAQLLESEEEWRRGKANVARRDCFSTSNFLALSVFWKEGKTFEESLRLCTIVYGRRSDRWASVAVTEWRRRLRRWWWWCRWWWWWCRRGWWRPLHLRGAKTLTSHKITSCSPTIPVRRSWRVSTVFLIRLIHLFNCVLFSNQRELDVHEAQYLQMSFFQPGIKASRCASPEFQVGDKELW